MNFGISLAILNLYVALIHYIMFKLIRTYGSGEGVENVKS